MAELLYRVWYYNIPERNEVNAVLGHDAALQGYTGPGTTWVYDINEQSKVISLMQDVKTSELKLI